MRLAGLVTILILAAACSPGATAERPARSILAGHSFGGLFTANVLVRHPEAFSGWLISSGSLWAKDEGVVRAAQRAPASERGRGAKVYLSVGEQEGPVMADPIRRFGEALSVPGSGFRVFHKMWEGETHVSVPAMAYSRGLRILLALPQFGDETAPAQ